MSLNSPARNKSKPSGSGAPERAVTNCWALHASGRRFSWIFPLLVFTATILAYQPAWNGKPIWDDDAHLTKPELLSVKGLERIWIEPGATQQYYPLVHTVFWVEHQVWGNTMWCYHLVNILLHAGSAWLFLKILLRLEVPGAYLASAIFAMHPVHVESVAWISELKNTLSGLLYLSAALQYLTFDQTRRTKPYILAFVFFALGLMAKSIIASLPAAVLVVFWWKGRRLNWGRDVLPLAPFFAAGIAAGLFTAWMERRFVGAQGREFTFSLIERILIAGRAFWFYLGKLFWPTSLAFEYPRWNINQAAWWQYLFPAAALALLTALWKLRRTWRGPLAGFLFFGGTLFPALGFLNVYPFRYSFVADHFQYLASLGIIALTAAGIASVFAKRRLWTQSVGIALCVMLVSVLGILTWRQSRGYTDVETLWTQTLRTNPDAFMAYGNRGTAFSKKGQFDEAIENYRKIIQINPNDCEALDDLGVALAAKGQFDEAIENYRKVIQINPNDCEVLNNLGVALAAKGQFDEAIENYRKVIQINPNDREALDNLGTALVAKGQFDEAIENYRKAIQINPNDRGTLDNLGVALADKGWVDEAIENFRKAIQINPNDSEAQYNLGNALAAKGQFDEAIKNYRKAIQNNPSNTKAQYNLGNALLHQGRFDEAIENYYKAVRINPNFSEALNNLGIALTAKGQFDEAIENYRRAIQINPNYCDALDNLGVALATKGRFDEAIENYRQAIQVNSNRPETFFHLGITLGLLGRPREAVAQYREALRLNPNLAEALNNLAWKLATCSDEELRNGAEAVRLAERACELSHYGEPLFIGTLATAYAECGRFPEAVTTAEKAEQLATDAGSKKLAEKIRQLLALYRAGKPYHELAPTAP